jgi:hypothetical protein
VAVRRWAVGIKHALSDDGILDLALLLHRHAFTVLLTRAFVLIVYPSIYKVVFCLPTKLQLECYNNILDSDDVIMINRRDEVCDHNPPWVVAGKFGLDVNPVALYFIARKLERILPQEEWRVLKKWAS